MEITKIYVVVLRSAGFNHASEKTLGFYLSKSDAEYLVWQLTKDYKTLQNQSSFHTNNEDVYLVREISALSPKEKDKEYKKFAEEKAKQIDSEMIQIVNSSMSNLEKMSVLSKEFDYYKSILK